MGESGIIQEARSPAKGPDPRKPLRQMVSGADSHLSYHLPPTPHHSSARQSRQLNLISRHCEIWALQMAAHSVLCLENPRDGEADGLPSMG